MTKIWKPEMFLHNNVSLDVMLVREKIGYSKKALRHDLVRLKEAWRKFQRSRNRDAVYGFLTEIFELAAWWEAGGKLEDHSSRVWALKPIKPHDLPDDFESYAILIRAAACPKDIDKRVVSKWSRVLRYAEARKVIGQPLDKFVKAKGGINACASEYSRSLRRLSKYKSKNKRRRCGFRLV